MENTRTDFGKRIELLRKQKDISQDILAERAGITQNNLSRIENGKYSPGLDILLKIGDALGEALRY